MTIKASHIANLTRVLLIATFIAGCFSMAPAADSAPTPTPAASPSQTPVTAPVAPSEATNGTAKRGSVVLPAEKSQPVRVTRFEKAPVIDGRLDDEIWKSAATFRNFYQTSPGDNVTPSKPTEVMMGYDSRTLYIAFHCFDEPDKVRSSVAKRDDVLNGTEDSIRVLLDTFNDQRKAYVLAFNPLGVQ